MTIKVETANRHRRPVAVEVYNTDKVRTMKHKFLKAAQHERVHVPEEFVFMCFGRVLEEDQTLKSVVAKDPTDPTGIRDLHIEDNTSVYFISDAMEQWDKQ